MSSKIEYVCTFSDKSTEKYSAFTIKSARILFKRMAKGRDKTIESIEESK